MSRRDGRRERRHHRYDVKGVAGSLQFTFGVKIVNISAGGMQVETTSHLPVGRHYSCKLVRDNHNLLLSGRVTWCVPASSTSLDGSEVAPRYNAGIAFDHMLTGVGADLVEFIDRNVVVELQRRVFGRFTPDGPTTATIGTAYDFRVVRISLSGMLIVTELVPEVETSFALEIRLGDKPFRAVARVAYVNPLPGEDGGAELGIEFTALEETHRTVLKAFIEREFLQEDPVLGETTPENGGG